MLRPPQQPVREPEPIGRLTLALGALLALTACGRTQPYRYPPPVAPVPDAGVLPACVPGVVNPVRELPKVFFVIDRSGSMLFDFAGHAGGLFGEPLIGPRRWDVLSTSLSRTLPRHDQDLEMGAVLFPGADECGVSASDVLEPRVGNVTNILALFAREPSGGTPTFEALNFAGVRAAAADARVLVLITDGQPNCNPMLDTLSCVCTSPKLGLACADSATCLDDARSVDAIRRLRNEEGIVTYVVGIAAGDTVTKVTLGNMALVGGAPRAGDPSFYSAESEDELTQVLAAISSRITRCAWTAHRELHEGDAIEVLVGGAVVPARDGWTWQNSAEGAFSLVGEWCDRATAGAAVTVRLDCH